ncbi:hypothetical protein ABES25_21075 [Bacillus gobiensis]
MKLCLKLLATLVIITSLVTWPNHENLELANEPIKTYEKNVFI